MFNPDLKKLLKNCNSRYSLVIAAAKRAREIRNEAVENEVLLDDKSVSLAIDEILEGKYVVEEPDELKGKKKEQKAQNSNEQSAPADGGQESSETSGAKSEEQ